MGLFEKRMPDEEPQLLMKTSQKKTADFRKKDDIFQEEEFQKIKKVEKFTDGRKGVQCVKNVKLSLIYFFKYHNHVSLEIAKLVTLTQKEKCSTTSQILYDNHVRNQL